jgi:hypothetical protein
MKPMMMMKRTQKTPREAPIAVPMTTLEMKETKGQRVSHGFTAFLAQYMGWIKAAVAGIRQTWVQRCLNRSRIEGSYCDKRVLGIHKITVGRLIQLGK